MKNWSNILSVFEAKGWNLYKALSEPDPSKVIPQGKTTFIKRDVPYLMLPATDRDDDVDEVRAQMANAKQTNQRPTFNDSQIEFVMFTEKGLNIKTKGLKDIYFFDMEKMEDAIKYQFSNYNVHYFSSIDELSAYFRKRGIEEQTPTELPEQLRWEYAHAKSPSGDLMVTIYPSNPSPVLFRGQNKRYRPCLPTILRNVKTRANALGALSQAEQASVILNLIRTEWFNENLRQTAAMRWMSDQRIAFNEIALAQHYGLPTGYIDLSQSFAVSSFFACCEYDPKCQAWQPTQEGEGVIYVVDVTQTPPGSPAKPICLQPFPRPSEQWGWVYEIVMGQDFDTFPHVRKFVFKHDTKASERIFKQFKGGRALFPPDPLSEVAHTITQSRQIPRDIAKRFVHDLINDRFGLPGEQAQSVLHMVEQEMGVTFSASCARSVMNPHMMNQMDAIWKQRKIPISSGKGIGVRFVRTRKPDDLTY